ncbi:MAG TPA: hypothetical protein VNW92_00075 [Polyangiaceae bacterium]|nr:hypothetical protein [Polyangiaceae bacterium]
MNSAPFGSRLRVEWGRSKQQLKWAALVSAWFGCAAAGVVALQKYKSAPAAEEAPPVTWPVASRLSRVPGKPTLVLVAHPRCPCTRATVQELGVLMARAGSRVTAHVLFVKPTGVAEDWERTDLWRSAAAIPGVSVTADDGGHEAALFHAVTSGQVVLFDPAGRELFAGGITESRGHEGDNPGLARVVSLLVSGKAELAKAPVFGCALNDPKFLAERTARNEGTP